MIPLLFLTVMTNEKLSKEFLSKTALDSQEWFLRETETLLWAFQHWNAVITKNRPGQQVSHSSHSYNEAYCESVWCKLQFRLRRTETKLTDQIRAVSTNSKNVWSGFLKVLQWSQRY